jgi:pimeloyl-ACP methyl ester carboxylesterase
MIKANIYRLPSFFMKPWKFFRLASLMIRLARGVARSRSSHRDAVLPPGPVNRSRECTPSGIVFDRYQHQRKSRGTWVLVHGITVHGGQEPRLVRFAHSLTRSGVTCVVPTLKGLASCRWEPGDIDALVDVIVTVSTSLQKPVGLIGFSYGGSYCLLAAVRKGVAPHVSRVISFGAYHNMKTLLEYYMKAEEKEPRGRGEWDERIYRRLVLLQGYGRNMSLPPEAQQEMKLLMLHYSSDASLEEKKKFYHRYLQGLDMTEMIKQISEPGILRELSPEGSLSGLSCPVTLIHQQDDPVVPSVHAERLYSELKSLPNPERFRLVMNSLLSHVSPANIFQIRDGIRLSLALAPIASGGQGGSFRENRPPGPPAKAFHYKNGGNR